MSLYTTGQLAQQCGVSVRTVQYYDSRGILAPTALSEGGRRLYSQADLEKLRLICFLRSLELPIDTIKGLLAGEHPERVIAVLLQEQEKLLREEIARKQAQADRITQVSRTLQHMAELVPVSIGDVARIVKNKRQLRRLRVWMLAVGLIMDAIQVSTLMVWIFRGIWWPFALGLGAVIALGVWISWVYFRSTAYICPECHAVFQPGLRQSLFARHTPWTRRLTCTHCGHFGYCVETYREETPKC